MKTIQTPRRAAGFSLIEVLIAVVVLSIGLLALASLQMNLIRSSGDAKSQTVALALAKETLEQRRTFTDMADYEALTDVAEGAATTTTMGGTVFSIWQEVDRYAWHTADAEFKAHADTGALGSGYVRNNEFKTVRVHVGWTDATGAEQEVVLEDAISAIPPENSARVARKRIDASNRKPRVIISDPSLEDGVIPIAIGDGSETAATNPRPNLAGFAGESVRETNFDIYTYSALNDGTAQAQARVETAIVGCRCDKTTGDGNAIAFRPAFWNGTRYETPEEAPYPPPAGQAMDGNRPVEQSDLCDACCRDHHDDESGTLGALYSPRREEHTHFDGLTLATEEYDEACRLIRVDGFLRVAPDMYNEHFNLLKTASEFELPPPDDTAAGLYQDFVIDFLDTQFTDRSSGYNTSLTEDQANTLAAPLVVDNVTVEQYQDRWLHSRGLYVDYLESDAVNAINNAKSNCADGLTTSECVLRVLPFTSINLSEVADWAPSTEDLLDDQGEVIGEFDILTVAKADFVEALTEGTPVRGKVQAKGGGTTLAASMVRHSNTGLIGDEDFFINDDEETPEKVFQEFTVEGPACGNSLSNGSLASGATDRSPSAEPCEAALQGYLTTTILLTMELETTLGAVTVVLEGPNGARYAVLTDAAPPTGRLTYTFSPTSDAAIAAGNWTLEVTSEDNGQADSVRAVWSVEYVSGGLYSVSWTNYPFAQVTTSYPGISASPSATCNPGASGNPYTCSTISVNTATDLTLGSYNYTEDRTYASISCTKSNGSSPQSCANLVGPVCRNFSVVSATAVHADSSTSTGTVSTITNDGRGSETTLVRFTTIGDGDAITIDMTEGTATLATCTYSGNAANACNNPVWSNPCQ